MDKARIDELNAKAYKLRKRFLDIFTALGYGHLTTAYSETEILVALFYEVMQYDAKDWRDDNHDFLFLSKGHGAGMVYPVLEDIGLITSAQIENMLCLGANPAVSKQFFLPGFEFYGGSLGLGLGMASGLAYALKMNRDTRLVFCVMGDAECYEGSVWEAAVFAAHNQLNNLAVIVDRNYMGCSDFTENMCCLEPFEEKWKSCGWNTKKVDGHSVEALTGAMAKIRTRDSNCPLCIVAETTKGKGLLSVSNLPLMHGYMPKGDAVLTAYENLKMTKR